VDKLVAPEPQRLWTRHQADDVLGEISEVLDVLRGLQAERHDAQAQLTDMRIVYGLSLDDPQHEAYEEFKGHVRTFQAAQARLLEVVNAFFAQGVQLSDAVNGYVDFLSAQGNSTSVLCWRRGERRIQHWHDLGEECDARRPIPDTMMH
jgi:hypothetical protein